MLTISLTFSWSAFSHSGYKSIYGSDNRIEIEDIRNPLFIELARSVAVMVDDSDLKHVSSPYKKPGVYTFDGSKTLEKRMNVCADQPFSDQPSLGNCTGFLLGEDILVTAGHCIDESDCQSTKWVFDFYNETTFFPEENVYRCQEILERKNTLPLFRHIDYAVVLLDREVEGRDPLEFRRSGRPKRGTPLVIIGHPSGLPMKAADNAQVRRHRPNFFYANVDSFGGNSGSPVFNGLSGVVEGILVRSFAGSDYVKTNDGCVVPRVSPHSRSRQIIQRITGVPGLELL